MTPTLQSGDWVFVDLRKQDISVNDVIIAKPSQFPKVITKRVLNTQLKGEQQYFLISDNIQSKFDSRLFDWVNDTGVIGIVQWSF